VGIEKRFLFNMLAVRELEWEPVKQVVLVFSLLQENVCMQSLNKLEE
jgi:hypothetical protein